MKQCPPRLPTGATAPGGGPHASRAVCQGVSRTRVVLLEHILLRLHRQLCTRCTHQTFAVACAALVLVTSRPFGSRRPCGVGPDCLRHRAHEGRRYAPVAIALPALTALRRRTRCVHGSAGFTNSARCTIVMTMPWSLLLIPNTIDFKKAAGSAERAERQQRRPRWQAVRNPQSYRARAWFSQAPHACACAHRPPAPGPPWARKTEPRSTFAEMPTPPVCARRHLRRQLRVLRTTHATAPVARSVWHSVSKDQSMPRHRHYSFLKSCLNAMRLYWRSQPKDNAQPSQKTPRCKQHWGVGLRETRCGDTPAARDLCAPPARARSAGHAVAQSAQRRCARHAGEARWRVTFPPEPAAARGGGGGGGLPGPR